MDRVISEFGYLILIIVFFMGPMTAYVIWSTNRKNKR